MKIGEWLRAAQLQLARIGAPGIEAQLIVGHVYGRDRSWVLAHAPDFFEQVGVADQLLERRLRREPLAYIVGWREFFGRRFGVGPGVLIPRQETEVLVEAALDAIDRGFDKVLDLGCGSGIIGITLKLERPAISMTCVDVSRAAIDRTKQNAQMLDAEIQVLHSNLFEQLEDNSWNLIVSNPPYIDPNEFLATEVAQFEPAVALYATEEGYGVYKALAIQARDYLLPTGEIWLEVGYTQSDHVAQIFETRGWEIRERRRDLQDHERVVGFHPKSGTLP